MVINNHVKVFIIVSKESSYGNKQSCKGIHIVRNLHIGNKQSCKGIHIVSNLHMVINNHVKVFT